MLAKLIFVKYGSTIKNFQKFADIDNSDGILRDIKTKKFQDKRI